MSYKQKQWSMVRVKESQWLSVMAADWSLVMRARWLVYDPVLFGFSGPRPARGSVLHYVITLLVMLFVDKTFVLKALTFYDSTFINTSDIKLYCWIVSGILRTKRFAINIID